MTYLVLARKYRPRRFQDLVGQTHVVRALSNALESGRIHHAYLFTGTRGVGKTTLSRILAKCLNCERGVSADPCGQCEACQAIDADRFVDYIELDAASNRGVNDMQQLLEQAAYAPTAARYKVYMVDEVHMLSNQAFNAMLKTLEEPPDYVKFILATTDPQKIPVTVLSRCLQFNLKQMPEDAIVAHLSDILDKETIRYELPALRQLAHGARGSMRDALSLTDQAIAYAAGDITAAAVQDMLGSLDQTYLLRLLECLSSQDGAGMLAVADEMASRGLSYQAALQELSTLFNRIAIIQCVPDYQAGEGGQAEALRSFAQRFTPEEVQLYYSITIHGLQEIGLAPDEYAGFTMTLLRMLAFVPSAGQGENQPSPKPRIARPQVPAKGKPAQPISPKPMIAAPGSQEQPSSSLSVKPSVMRSEAVSSAAPQPQASAPAVAEKPGQAAIQWDGDWPGLVKDIPFKGGLVRQLAQQTELVRYTMEDGGMVLLLRSPTSAICTVSAISKLSEWLADRFGCPVKIRTEIGKAENTANRDAREAEAARQQQAEAAMGSDPYIQSLVSGFDARIVEGSIKPTDSN